MPFPGFGTLYMGYDYRKAYLPDVTLTGAGQTVAIVSLDGYRQQDVDFYLQNSNPPLPSVPVREGYLSTIHNVDRPQPGIETPTNIEMAISAAPGLSAIYLYWAEFPREQDAYDAIVDDLLDKVANPPAGIPRSNQATCSWYQFHSDNLQASLQEMAMLGTSFFLASGDKGAYGGLQTGFPDPYNRPEINYMTLVGGTLLSTGANAVYQSERVWNDRQGASGGGILTQVPIPFYQLPIASQISAAGGDPTKRAIPDISAVADGIEAVDNLTPMGDAFSGTSLTSPLWAGFAALINERNAINGRPPLGFANPALYALLQGPNYAVDFHDITVGNNDFLQLGNPFDARVGYDLATGIGSPAGQHLIDDLGGPAPVLGGALAAGHDFTCAIVGAGAVDCWGVNSSGQLGDGTTTSRATPAPVVGLTDAVALTAGDIHACALRSNGAIACWGGNSLGYLGNGTNVDSTIPVPVSGISTAQAVAAGHTQTCALLADGTVRCWGLNLDGQLGNGTTMGSNVPVAVSGLTGVTGITAGGIHSCARRSDSTVWCWGGLTGDGSGNESNVPTQVAGLTDAISVSSGEVHACALRATGTAVCWGNGIFGALGDGTFGQIQNAPVAVNGLTGISAIDGGGLFTCARVGGAVWCWGENNSGQIGTGSDFTNKSIPTQVIGLTNATDLSSGQDHSCVRTQSGTLLCWGHIPGGDTGTPTPVQF
jgi:alpha-tubulin suppressor-like RCC1 family protein